MSLRPVEDALFDLLAGARPVEASEMVPLRQAAGRILSADIAALRTQPDFDASAMDGYALRAGDAAMGARLRVIGESQAGRAYAGALGNGEAVRIFTGAPVPTGADTVLIQENVERAGDEFVVAVSPERGANIRPAGNDFAAGHRLLGAGGVLTAGMVALAASGGHPRLPVRRRPVVAILATGDELVQPGQPVGPSQIVASNGYGVAAVVEANGGEVLDLGIAPDDIEAIGARLDEARARQADIFVSIGGASVGDHDLAARAFETRGVSLDFWKVAMRPGKPIMAGRLGAMRIVGLPGNPASSMVAATVFLVPLLRRLAGHADIERYRRARLGTDLPANDHRAEFMRSTLTRIAGDGDPVIEPLGRQDSSLLSIYAGATALLMREAHAAPARKGELVRYLPLD